MTDESFAWRIRWLDGYQAWLRQSRTYMKWLDRWAFVIVIGAPLGGGWALMHVVLSWMGFAGVGLPIWLLVWVFLAPPLYFAATGLLRLAAGGIDVRIQKKTPRPG